MIRLIGLPLMAILLVAGPATYAQLAFPTAEGYGAGSVGGRGGVVIYVGNLDDNGSPWPACASESNGCSLRSALYATVPRTVLFRVSGTIELQSRLNLKSSNSFLTVAGQTAPGDGIQLKNFGIMMVGVHDVILRHLRVRPGVALMTPATFSAHDALNIVDSRDIIVDHCSIEWGPDETLSVWQESQEVTVQWTIIAEAPVMTLLPGYTSGKSLGFLSGGQPGGVVQTVTLHHNLFAHVTERAPRISQGRRVDIRNNVGYNWEDGAVALGMYQSEHEHQAITNIGSPEVNFIGNYYKAGPDSNNRMNGKLGGLRTKVHMTDNYAPGCPGTCPDPWNTFFIENNPALDLVNPGPYGARPLQECSGSCVAQPCRDCFPAGDGTCQGGSTFSCRSGKCQGGPFADKECRSNAHCTDNGRGCEVRGTTLQQKFAATTPFSTPAVVTTPAQAAYLTVLEKVGATLPIRDSLDARIVGEVLAGTGSIGCGATGVACLHPEDWPVLQSGTPPVDSDRDGMPNTWEQARGLNPNDPNDGRRDNDSNGYTDLEDYLNGLSGPSSVPPPPVSNVRRDDTGASQ